MNCKVVACTSEVKDFTVAELEKMKEFNGVMAGICYMPDTYDTLNANREAANKRYANTSVSGHHSVGEHSYITVVFENTSKAFAMLLNSLQAYNTSEKSGRYTIMTSESDEANALYKKWYNIFNDKFISEVDFNVLTEEQSKAKCIACDKKAKELARMTLSVFTKATTFAYTASLSRWNYILCWTEKYIENLKILNDTFANKLIPEMEVLRDYLYNTLKVEGVTDKKNNEFDFILNLVDKDSPYTALENFKEGYVKSGVNYTAVYRISFVGVAQAERHRTLKYNIFIPGMGSIDNSKNLRLKSSKITYYVPEVIINDNKLREDWLNDLKSVDYPQAMEVIVIERGTIEKFLLKCKERLCGAAQEEVRNVTAKTFAKLLNCDDVLEESIVHSFMKPYLDADGVPKVKCELCGGCSRPCGLIKQLKTDFKTFMM